jgi:hypothetical protein
VRPYLSSTLQEPPPRPRARALRSLRIQKQLSIPQPHLSRPRSLDNLPPFAPAVRPPPEILPSALERKSACPFPLPVCRIPISPKNPHCLRCSHACLRTYYRVLTSRRGCTGNPNHSAVSRTSVSTISWRMHFRATFKLPTTYPRLTRIPVAEQQDSVKEVLPHGPIVEQHENRDQPSQIPFP